MRTRTGRRIAIVTVLAVIVIAGALLWLSRDHIRFFLAFESLGPNAQGYAEFRHRQTGIVFVNTRQGLRDLFPWPVCLAGFATGPKGEGRSE